MRPIIVATGNAGKLREIGELLADLPVSLTSLVDHWKPVPSIPETGDTFFENALQKAMWVAQRRDNVWVLADDSGLEVDALAGKPGVRSARFAGDNADVAANNRLLLDLLSHVPQEERTARFKCAMVLVVSAERYFLTEGVCEGSIITEPRGDKGFGYDPLFIPSGFSRTFGEMESVEKHPLSHRGLAMGKMKERIREII